MKENLYKKLFFIIMVCLILSSTVVFFSPFVDFDNTGIHKLLGYISGIIFWLGLFLGVVIYSILSTIIKKEASFEPDRYGKGIGLVKFFSNKQARIWDAICIFMILLNILFICLKINLDWLEVIGAFMLLLAFYCHCLFNGRIYQYLFYGQKRRTL